MSCVPTPISQSITGGLKKINYIFVVKYISQLYMKLAFFFIFYWFVYFAAWDPSKIFSYSSVLKCRSLIEVYPHPKFSCLQVAGLQFGNYCDARYVRGEVAARWSCRSVKLQVWLDSFPLNIHYTSRFNSRVAENTN